MSSPISTISNNSASYDLIPITQEFRKWNFLPKDAMQSLALMLDFPKLVELTTVCKHFHQSLMKDYSFVKRYLESAFEIDRKTFRVTRRELKIQLHELVGLVKILPREKRPTYITLNDIDMLVPNELTVNLKRLNQYYYLMDNCVVKTMEALGVIFNDLTTNISSIIAKKIAGEQLLYLDVCSNVWANLSEEEILTLFDTSPNLEF
jgi:hypothetical protein